MRSEVTRVVRREAAGDDEGGTAARALCIEGGEPPRAVGPRLEARVHRAHHDAVRQRGEAQVERPEEQRVHESGYFRRTKKVPSSTSIAPASMSGVTASPRNSAPQVTPKMGIR